MLMYFDPYLKYDIYDYDSDEVEKFASVIKTAKEIPSFIFDSKVRQVAPSKKTDDMFAIVIKEGSEKFRKFPLDNIADTFFSQESFLMNFDNLPLVSRGKCASSIKKACEFFGLPVDDFVEKCAQSSIQFENMEENEVDFNQYDPKYLEDKIAFDASNIKSFAIPSEKKYPLNTQQEIKVACNFFKENIQALREDNVSELFATNLKKACDNNGIECPVVVYDEIDNESKIDQHSFRKSLKSRMKIAFDHNWSQEETENVKIAYENLVNNSRYMKRHDVVSELKNLDKTFFKLATYRTMRSPEEIVYEDACYKIGSETFIDSETTTTNPNLDIIHDGKNNDYSACDSKEEIKDFVKKNPDALKGYFSNETVVKLVTNFDTAFNELDSEDKLGLINVVKDHIEDL